MFSANAASKGVVEVVPEGKDREEAPAEATPKTVFGALFLAPTATPWTAPPAKPQPFSAREKRLLCWRRAAPRPRRARRRRRGRVARAERASGRSRTRSPNPPRANPDPTRTTASPRGGGGTPAAPPAASRPRVFSPPRSRPRKKTSFPSGFRTTVEAVFRVPTRAGTPRSPPPRPAAARRRRRLRRLLDLLSATRRAWTRAPWRTRSPRGSAARRPRLF